MYRFMLYRRDPFVIWTLAFFIVACVVDLLTGARPGTAAALVPRWYLDLWLVVTLLASIGYCYGIFTKKLFNGLFITYSLCPILSVSTVAIGTAQLWVGGSKALLSGLLVIGLGVAFLRQRQLLGKIIKDLPKKAQVKK